MPHSNLIISTATFLTLVSDIALVLFGIGLVLRVPAILATRRFLAAHVLGLSLLVTAGALCGSLLFSNVLGFDPCVLCWIQRIFIYPQVLLVAMAMYFKEHTITKYLLGLSHEVQAISTSAMVGTASGLCQISQHREGGNTK